MCVCQAAITAPGDRERRIRLPSTCTGGRESIPLTEWESLLATEIKSDRTKKNTRITNTGVGEESLDQKTVRVVNTLFWRAGMAHAVLGLIWIFCKKSRHPELRITDHSTFSGWASS
ncbi:hypothetical protein AVEN_43246-1 [Araneus ventricosus]|uniref:Uncharacterized protein n=1 Tax=Araneus ventricosus TaxID=182803 RepID=A0A4Y2V058_ARAVE|nr:hypothetical protein AVEN_171187-1 [Araneus ventricosus]GBO18036.1 hypothetical protein AVEN_43246-1 [Araneus ventricosus]